MNLSFVSLVISSFFIGNLVCITLGIWNLVCISNRSFPESFQFGVSSSAYQSEGAWNVTGKGLSMWDVLLNSPPFNLLFQNGNIACDSYNKVDEDVNILKNLGVKYYRFSIAWTRIMPNGTKDHINQDGIDHYYNFLTKLKEAGIEPMVTMYHFDLPAKLMKEHYPFEHIGWVNNNVVDYFVDYAELLFSVFGSMVKFWITINEPKMVCVDILNVVSKIPSFETYKCIHNIIRAHGKVYRLYDKQFRSSQGGKISMSLNVDWMEPISQNEEDVEAAERALLFHFGIFAHPLVFGNYPDVVKQKIDNCSWGISRLPNFSVEDAQEIKGSLDFISINHYTTQLVQSYYTPCDILLSDFDKDIGATFQQNSSWEGSGMDRLKVVPWGFRKILNWLRATYGEMEIIVTENGYPSLDTSLEDPKRISYHQKYLSALLDAIYIDGVNVTSYNTWSIMDNFEWTFRYRIKFGLYYVNFSDPHRMRTARKSADYYMKIISTKCLVDSCE